MIKRVWLPLLAAALLASAGLPVHAQDETSEENSLYAIEVKADERIPTGRSAFLQGDADTTGQKFILEGLYLDDPVVVSVFTQNPGERVRVRLVKDSWEKPERDEQTDDQQRVDLKFRTFDGFKIWVTADTPTAYQLVVWVGDKLQLPVPSIAIPASEYAEGQTASSDSSAVPTPTAAAANDDRGGVSLSYLELGLIAALLLVIIAFGGFLLTRRKSSSGA